MFKVCLILALTALSAVAAQEAAGQPEAAPEPYSYAYSTDTHAAQEQRDPSGKVTGSYQLVGDDGRERRVEYVADENGYRAKVVTNEVGTKSENSADVEVVASEPTPAQLAQYVQGPPQAQYVRQQQVQQVQQVQRQVAAPAPIAVTTFQQQQQPAGYRQVSTTSSSYYKQAAPQVAYGYGSGYTQGYAPGYNYGYGYYPGYGYGANSGYYGYGANANNLGYAYTSGSPIYKSSSSSQSASRTSSGSGSGIINVGNYNNHLPSQYYSSIGQVSGGPVASVPVSGYSTVGTQGYRYVSQPAGVTTTTTNVRTVGVPSTYSVQPAVGTSNPVGSSNYIVLQKRAAEENSKSTAQ